MTNISSASAAASSAAAANSGGKEGTKSMHQTQNKAPPPQNQTTNTNDESDKQKLSNNCQTTTTDDTKRNSDGLLARKAIDEFMRIEKEIPTMKDVNETFEKYGKFYSTASLGEGMQSVVYTLPIPEKTAHKIVLIAYLLDQLSVQELEKIKFHNFYQIKQKNVPPKLHNDYLRVISRLIELNCDLLEKSQKAAVATTTAATTAATTTEGNDQPATQNINEFSSFLTILSGKLNYDRLYELLVDLSTKSLSKAPVYSRLLENFTKNLQKAIMNHSRSPSNTTTANSDPIVSILYSCCTLDKIKNEPLSILRREVMEMLINPQVFMHLIIHLESYHVKGATLFIPTIIDAVLPNLPNDFLNSLYSSNINSSLSKGNSEVPQGDIDSAFVWFVKLKYDMNDFIVKCLKTAANDHEVGKLANIAKITLKATHDLEGYKKLIPSIVALHLHSPKNLQVLSTHKRFINALIRKKVDLSVLAIYLDLAGTNSKFQIIFRQLFELIRTLYQTNVTSAGRDSEIRNFIAKFYTRDVEKSFDKLCNLIFANFKQIMDHTVDDSGNEALIVDTFIAIINISYNNDRFSQFLEELNRWQKVSELSTLFEFSVKALTISLNHCDDVNVFRKNCNRLAALAPKFQYNKEIVLTTVWDLISTVKPKFIAPFIEKIFLIYQNFPLESLVAIFREYYTSMHSHFSVQFLNYLLEFSKKIDETSRGIIKTSDVCLPALQAINSILRIYLDNFPHYLSIEPLSYHFAMLIEVNVIIFDMDSQNSRNFKFMVNSGTTFCRLLPQIWVNYVKNCVATECKFSFIRFLVDETPVTSQNLHFALNFLNSRLIFCRAIYFLQSATPKHLKMLPECMDFSYSHIMQLNEENPGELTQLPNHILLEDAKYDPLILNLIRISDHNNTFAEEVGNFLSLLIPNQSWKSRCLDPNFQSNIQPKSFLRIIAIHITLNGNRKSEKCPENIGKQIDLRKTFLTAIETIEYNPNEYLSNFSSYLVAYICMLHFHDKNKNVLVDILSRDSNPTALPSFCLPFLDADYSPNLSGLELFDPNSLREAAIPSMIFTLKPKILKQLLLLLIIRLVEKSLISQDILSGLFQMIFDSIINYKTKSNDDVVDHNDSLIYCLNLLSLNTPTELYKDSKFIPNIEWLKQNLDSDHTELISVFFTTFFKFFQLEDTSTHDELFKLFDSFFDAEINEFTEKDRARKVSFKTVIHLLHLLSCISYNRNLDKIIAKNKSKFLSIENVALDCIFDLLDMDLNNNEDKKRRFHLSDNFFKLSDHQVKEFLNLFSIIESRMNLKDLNQVIKKIYTLMVESNHTEVSRRTAAWNARLESNGYIGIKNPSNICYMLSVVQIIFCTVGNEFYNPKLDESVVRNRFDELSAVSESEESQESVDKNADGRAIEKSKPSEKKQPPEERLNLASYMTNEYCSELVKNFSRFIIDLFESMEARLSMEGFYSKFIMNQVPIKIDEQNDAMEFFHTLIDSFDTAVSVCYGKNKGNRVFQNNFSGTLRNTTFVESCKHTMKSQEQFSSVGVEVKDFSNLESSLKNFVAKRNLDGYMCDKCLEKSKKKKSSGQKADPPVDKDESLKAKLKNKASAKRQTMFQRLPKFLTLQLLRFYFDPKSANISKYNGFFEFPHFLDMQPYISKGGGNKPAINTSKNSQNRKETIQQQSVNSKYNSTTTNNTNTKVSKMTSPYFLRAIIIHSGSATGGHYYSFIKNVNYKSNEPQWLKYDDDKITICNLDDLKILQSECFGDPKIRANTSGNRLNEDSNERLPLEASATQEAINRSKSVKKGAYALFYQKYEPQLSLTQQIKFLNEDGLESDINLSNKCQSITEQSLKIKFAHSLQRNNFYANFLGRLIFTERLELTSNNIIQIFTIMSHILIYSKSQTQTIEAHRLFISKLNTAPIESVIGLANSILINCEKNISLIFTSDIGLNSPLAAQLLSEILKNIKTRGQMKDEFCPFSFVNQVLCNIESNFNLLKIRNYTLYILIFQSAEDINSFDGLWSILKCDKLVAFIIQSLIAKSHPEKFSLSNAKSSMLLEQQTESSESSTSFFNLIHNLLEILIRLIGKFSLQISKQIGQGLSKLHTMNIGKATLSAEELGQRYACLHLFHIFNYLITLTFPEKSTELSNTFFSADKTSKFNFIQEAFACFFNLDPQFLGNIFALHFLNYLSRIALWQVLEEDPRIDLLVYFLDTCNDSIIKQAILKPMFKKTNLSYLPMMYPDQKPINNNLQSSKSEKLSSTNSSLSKSPSILAGRVDCASIFSRLKQLQTLQSSQEIRQALISLYLLKISIEKKPELVDCVLFGKKQKVALLKMLVLELQNHCENSSSSLGRVFVAEDKELINYFAAHVAKMKKKLF